MYLKTCRHALMIEFVHELVSRKRLRFVLRFCLARLALFLIYIQYRSLLTYLNIKQNALLSVPRRRNSLNIKHPIWAKIILSFHILVGLAVSCLGLWLCWWAPSTRSRDNPYWSGLIVNILSILFTQNISLKITQNRMMINILQYKIVLVNFSVV